MKAVQRLGSIPVITANYAYSTYDTTATDGKVANAARLAADWVEYCNAPNDGSNPNGGTDWAAKRAADGSSAPFKVAYWEIGNEIFGNWETGYDSIGDTNAKNFNVVADAMKAVDPTIAVGLVVDPSPANSNWTKTVLAYPGTAQRADFLIVHTYFGWFSAAASVSWPSTKRPRVARSHSHSPVHRSRAKPMFGT
jgi:alpha-N-arabinofuranosidase